MSKWGKECSINSWQNVVLMAQISSQWHMLGSSYIRIWQVYSNNTTFAVSVRSNSVCEILFYYFRPSEDE